MNETLILLLLLLICHWLGDFSHLSTAWMLHADLHGPLLPILAHAGVHAGLMSSPQIALQLALFELGTHFAIGVWKGRMTVWFLVVTSPQQKAHWYLFGFDQLLHQTIMVLMVSWA
jgi:hypothetical protein